MIDTILLPAAGFGSRMRPFSSEPHKELLPIQGLPLLAHALNEARDAGLARAVIILRPGKEALRDCLIDLRAARARFPERAEAIVDTAAALELVFLFQREPLGECDAIARARNLVGNAAFAVLYPDNLYSRPPGALKHLLRAFAKRPTDLVALTPVPDDMAPTVSDSGRVDLSPPDAEGFQRVKAFQPKGSGVFVPRFPGEKRTCGLYLALPAFFEWIEAARPALAPGEELTDGKVRRRMLASGVPVWAAPLPAPMFDVGNPAGYVLARSRLET